FKLHNIQLLSLIEVVRAHWDSMRNDFLANGEQFVLNDATPLFERKSLLQLLTGTTGGVLSSAGTSTAMNAQ
ncbi:unnamed protein product, partial [Amoebophrya sp. A120]